VIYDHENDHLEKPGWKHPRTYEKSFGLDRRNGNTLLGDVTALELTKIDDYDSFINKGHHTKVKIPDGFKKTKDQRAQYQSMIGALQWIVTIGRFDTNAAVMTMSGFLMAPRVHLNRLNLIYGYLLKMKYASIRVRTEEPDFSDLPDNVSHDWTYSVYRKVEVLLPIGAPEPLENHVTLSHYVDANLMHDIAMGRLVTGIL
jgi:hypothetical protein